MPKLRIVGQLDFQYVQLKNAFNKKKTKEMSEIRPIRFYLNTLILVHTTLK